MSETFELISTTPIPQMNIVAKEYRHKCGMQVLSLECDDVENMFSVGFLTSPTNNKGTAHIIEHSLLSGSRHYPVKDPFMEMIKGSVATFINAITYPDHTVYPIATTLPKDFFNLASVYFDAIFNPLMTKQAFAQEGWHYELEKSGNMKSPLIHNGIVLNEMTGYMADIDEIINHNVNSILLKGTPRQYESGGIPEAITTLTYSQYKKFYREHYHPSKAKVFFYGNIPTEEKLSFLEKAIGTIETIPEPIKAKPRKQLTPWSKPRRRRVSFMPELAQDKCKGAWALAFFLTDEWEPLTDMTFEFIDYLLLGNGASPLRKAIMESKLCENIAISGYDNETLETNFIVAVNGININDFNGMRKLVCDTLRNVAANGFSQDELKAAFSQFKIEQQEIDSEYVYSQMEKVFDAWCYDKSPLLFLNNAGTLAKLEKEIVSKPEWLTSQIQKYLVDNAHTLTLELVPDENLAQKNKDAIAAKLASKKAEMSIRQLREIDRQAQELKQAQGAPNSPEALATLPHLTRDDISRKPYLLPKSTTVLPNGIHFTDVDLFTNGITYISMAFPLSAFSPDELKLLDTFMTIAVKVGTKNLTYDRKAMEWAKYGASYYYTAFSAIPYTNVNETNSLFEVRVKTLKENVPQVLKILKSQLEDIVFTEEDIIESVLKQRWSQNLESLSFDSRDYALRRSTAGLSPICSLQEMWTGLTAMQNNKKAAKSFRSTFKEIRMILESMERKISTLTPAAVCFEGDPESRKHVLEFASSFTAPILPYSIPQSSNSFVHLENGRREVLPIASDVSGYAKTFQAPHFWEDSSLPLSVFANTLSCGYLWDEVRLKGGAYGTSAVYNNAYGTFSITSSQDPNPKRTSAIADEISKYSISLTTQGLDNAILSTVKGLCNPVRPDKAPSLALISFFSNITDEIVIERFNRFLNLSQKEITDAVEALWAGKPASNECIIGPASSMPQNGVTKLKI